MGSPISRSSQIFGLAKNACINARAALQKYKSASKIRSSLPKDIARHELVCELIGPLREGIEAANLDWLNQRTDTPFPDKVVQQIIDAKAGNCQEYSILAYKELSRHPLGAMIEIMGPDNHLFVVIGRKTTVMPSAADKYVVEPPIEIIRDSWRGTPTTANWDFAVWNRDTIICDPWANIVCWAYQYPDKLAEKMRKWFYSGKDVYFYFRGSATFVGAMNLTVGKQTTSLSVIAREYISDFGGAMLAVSYGTSVEAAATEFLVTKPYELFVLETLRKGYLTSSNRRWHLNTSLKT